MFATINTIVVKLDILNNMPFNEKDWDFPASTDPKIRRLIKPDKRKLKFGDLYQRVVNGKKVWLHYVGDRVDEAAMKMDSENRRILGLDQIPPSAKPDNQ